MDKRSDGKRWITVVMNFNVAVVPFSPVSPTSGSLAVEDGVGQRHLFLVPLKLK